MNYIVNRNYLNEVIEVEPDNETSMHIYFQGTKYSKFGPTMFVFNSPEEADDFRNRILDEEIVVLEDRLKKVKDKKVKKVK